ncbi:MAG: DNA translocase FtsK 4TM domain-containing protein [Gammaproteobacteria bacterium]|nr:DNA translocase FtsK 4TM domain-containing protein [Gammaproteobacteria bacterium]
MKQATPKNTSSPSLFNNQRLREGLFILSCAVSLFLFLALLTYHQTDPGWSHVSANDTALNAGGQVGAWFADILLYLFGYPAYIFPLGIAYNGWARFHQSPPEKLKSTPWHWLGFVLALFAGCGLVSLHYTLTSPHLPYKSGGIVGVLTGLDLAQVLNNWGTTLLLLALFLSGITFFTGLSWLNALDNLGKYTLVFLRWLPRLFHSHSSAHTAFPSPQPERITPLFSDTAAKASLRKEPLLTKPPLKPIAAPDTPKEKIKIAKIEKSKQASSTKTQPAHLPPIDLLDAAEPVRQQTFSKTMLEEMSRRVEEKLHDFGIEVQVVAAHPGPVVTRFELQLAPGIKVSRITTLSKDLARSLSVISVRVVEVIPGKSYVGLELPNEHREIVRLSDVFLSQQYEQARSPLSLALGKDIAGHPAVVDLAKMPHLLVAGTTGSGKSVGLNGMLLSMLYKSSPDDVRLIMIDPKMLELSIYDDIPHLLTPVVTDMKEAGNALRWCITEMDRRYRLMAHLGVRNLAGYNHKIRETAQQGSPLNDPFVPPSEENPSHLQALPYVVVVIDEFADMMLVVGKKVEDLIARLAQKARAAGIHLILATQRPSVDVITGLIKANIPTRIAFQVSSKIDSRTIIDQQGAEQLLGYGDMLYLAPGTGVPVRIHGAFVADHEVHNVVNFLKQQGKPQYLEEVVQDVNKETPAQDGEGAELDPLYDQAVQLVTETRRASISNVQRRLKIGYNRAARMLEDMEKAGIVSEMQTNGNREVLANPAPSDL